MGWFDEQIRQRVENDEEVFEDALAQMENAVDGSRKIRETKGTGKRMTEEALQDILNYYHVKVREVPEHITDINEILEYLMRPSGVMRRRASTAGIITGNQDRGKGSESAERRKGSSKKRQLCFINPSRFVRWAERIC